MNVRKLPAARKLEPLLAAARVVMARHAAGCRDAQIAAELGIDVDLVRDLRAWLRLADNCDHPANLARRQCGLCRFFVPDP